MSGAGSRTLQKSQGDASRIVSRYVLGSFSLEITYGFPEVTIVTGGKQ